MTTFNYNSYTELVQAAMMSEENAQDWYKALKMIKDRSNEEDSIIKTGRKKHPGRTNAELLKPFENHLAKNFPLPVFNKLEN